MAVTFWRPALAYARFDESRGFGLSLSLAVALHVLVLVGVGFTFSRAAPPAPSLDVTLVRHQSSAAVTDAEVLAQYDQQGSGDESEQSQLDTPHPAPLADTRINDAGAPPQPEAAVEATEVFTVLSVSLDGYTTPDEAAEETRDDTVEPEPPLPPGDEIASLQARLQQAQSRYSRMPRTLRTTALSAQAASHAGYLAAWVEKVELTGNRHYPAEARQQRLYGDLQLAVTLLPDGSVGNIEILRSSGYPVLDQAARDTLLRAAPFDPFPPEMAARWDRFEIIRTWQFIPGNQVTTLP